MLLGTVCFGVLNPAAIGCCYSMFVSVAADVHGEMGYGRVKHSYGPSSWLIHLRCSSAHLLCAATKLLLLV